MHGLVHQQGLPQIPAAVLGDAAVEAVEDGPALAAGGGGEDGAYVVGGRGGDADEQGAAADGGDDVGGAVGEQDQAQVGAVLLHGAAEGGLGVAGQVVGLVDDDDLEALAGGLVDLLGLGDLLEQVLHDDAVVVADVRGRDLQVVDGGDDVELELPAAAGLEDAGVDLDLLDARPVQLLQRRHDAGLLAGAGGPVDEQMGEVAALRLWWAGGGQGAVLRTSRGSGDTGEEGEGRVRTSERSRSDSSG